MNIPERDLGTVNDLSFEGKMLVGTLCALFAWTDDAHLLARASRTMDRTTLGRASGVRMLQAPPPLAYELLRGSDIKEGDPVSAHPTCVMLHGILGSRRNLFSFAQRMRNEFPSWQFLLVDLRCHGQTSAMAEPPGGANTVEASALDVIGVLSHLNVYPTMLMGHSFGGKVVMSMI